METLEGNRAGNAEDKASSVEEIRKRRLAYFTPKASKQTYRDLKAEDNGNLFSNTAMTRNTSQGDKYLEKTGTNLMKSRQSASDSLQSGFQSPLFHQGTNEGPEQLVGAPRLTTSIHYIEKSSDKFTQSQEFDPHYVSQSQNSLSLSELGLSTHRPELSWKENSHMSDRDLGIYDSRTLEKDMLRGKSPTALNPVSLEQSWQKAKSNQKLDWNQRLAMQGSESNDSRERIRLPNNCRPNTGQSSQNPPFYLSDDKSDDEYDNFGGKRGGVHSGRSGHSSHSVDNLNEGEKKVLMLTRNYNHVTIPKNTKNSFSADEIYQQAFGALPESSISTKGFGGSDHKHSHWQRQSSLRDHSDVSKVEDEGIGTLGRSYSLDSGANAASPFQHLSPYQMMHLPPPGYNHSPNSNSTSPRSAVLSPTLYPSDMSYYHHSGFYYPGQYHTSSAQLQNQYYPHSSDHSSIPRVPYPHHMPPTSSALSQPLNSLCYPPPPYNGGPYSVPRFPNGVPLHLPPPPIPSPSQIRGDGIKESTEEAMPFKVPHPPHVPPALKNKGKDGNAIAAPSFDHRRISGYTSHPSQHGGYPAYYSREEEGSPNLFNLQRYFSSLELHTNRSSANENDSFQRTAPTLNSSRSVEGDFYNSGNKNPVYGTGVKNNTQTTDYVSGGVDEDEDGISSVSSGFTSVTASTRPGRASGLTGRLEGLGVDLEHLRHLRVVEDDQAQFEMLSKGVRVCPECGVSNKAYMDWCLGCGEVLIGVDPVLLSGSKTKSKKGEDQGSGSAKTSARSRSSSTGQGQSNNDRGRNSSCFPEQRKAARNNSNSRFSERRGDNYGGYTPKESPESGRGVSLSSSPVRYRREQKEDGTDEPKDSGRASSNDGPERIRTLTNENFKLGDEDDDNVGNYSDGDALYDGAEIVEDGEIQEEEGVEYQYQDSEPNFFEQIKDPVLRDFIISYRNKHILKEGKKASEEDMDNTSKTSNVGGKAETHHDRSSESIKTSMNLISNITGSRTKQFDKRNTTGKSESSPMPVAPGTESSQLSNIKSQVMVNGLSEEKDVSSSQLKKSKKKKKKAKKAEPMDVEIFGYEEIRQSRDSSRANQPHAIPLLNLAGSSDEEDEDDDEDDDDDDDVNDDGNVPVDNGSSSEDDGNRTQESKMWNQHTSVAGNSYSKSGIMSKMHQGTNSRTTDLGRQGTVSKSYSSYSSGDVQGKTNSYHHSTTPSKFAPTAVNDRFARPSSASYARQHGGSGRSNTSGGYQRHWARSSTAWSSYHPRELSTRSSLPAASSDRNLRVPKREPNGRGLQNRSSTNQSLEELPGSRTGGGSGQDSRPSSGSSASSGGAGGGIPLRQRPASADYSRRGTPQLLAQRPSSAQTRPRTVKGHPVPLPRQPRMNNYMMHDGYEGYGDGDNRERSHQSVVSEEVENHSSVNRENYNQGETGARRERSNYSQSEEGPASPRVLCPELHRLPFDGSNVEHAGKMHAMAKSSYDKLQEMTPRISDGEVSIWQCLPDEIWLYVFDFLAQGDLGRLMQSCHYFYRLANDETLWKYITVKPKMLMQDEHMAAIAQHRPLSLAMVMCNGRDLSEQALHNFFQQTQGRLKELNVCGCSHGALTGGLVLETAAKYCHDLTHLDASYCNLTDAAMEAISQSADELESLCVNGFQGMSDSCLLKIVKKHGKGLRTLEMYACFSLSASSLRSLGEHCTRLRRLCLGSCNKLTDSAMITLSAHLGRIEELDLRGCKNLKNDCIRKIVRNCPRLTKLVLANCPHISDLALTEVATHLKTTLRSLELCGCNSVTDQGVTTLAKNCDRLVSLDISSTKCTTNSVLQLASNGCSRWLETVKLSFLTPMTEASVIRLIKQCPRLKILHVFGCSSLRNLSRLRQLNPKLAVEGDEKFPKFTFSSVDC